MEAQEVSNATEHEEKLCLVCNDVSSGNHYGAITCEGCKGFFRRIICHNNENSYKCINNENPDQCPITNDGTRRKCCKSCRFRRCLAIGMKPELCVKIEKPKSRSRNGIDFMDDSQPLFESDEEMRTMKEHIFSVFSETMTFKPLADFPLVIRDGDYNSFRICLNQMRIQLAAKVRTFVSNIDTFRQLDIKVQRDLISESVVELLTLMFINELSRFKTLIKFNEIFFGDKDLDEVFKTCIVNMNEMVAIIKSSMTTEPQHSKQKDPILDLIPALNLLVILDSHRFEVKEEWFENRRQIQFIKNRILKAYGFKEELKGAAVSQILYHLRRMNALFGKRNIFLKI